MILLTFCEIYQLHNVTYLVSRHTGSSDLLKSENIYGQIKMLFFSSIPRPTFSATREYFFWHGLHGEACNLGLHLCVSSTRLPAKRHEHNMSSTRGERRGEQREKNGEGERRRRRGARKPVTSNYTARFIIYCRQFLLPPRRCIRPTIEG